MIGFSLLLGLAKLLDRVLDLLVLVVGLLALLDLGLQLAHLFDDLLLLLLREHGGHLLELKALKLLLKLGDRGSVLRKVVLLDLRDLFVQLIDEFVPLVPLLLRLPDLHVKLVPSLAVFGGLVNKLPDLSVQGIPLLNPFPGLLIQFVAGLPVPLSLDVMELALLFELLQEFSHNVHTQ